MDFGRVPRVTIFIKAIRYASSIGSAFQEGFADLHERSFTIKSQVISGLKNRKMQFLQLP
jgi:hypothetical protein